MIFEELYFNCSQDPLYVVVDGHPVKIGDENPQAVLDYGERKVIDFYIDEDDEGGPRLAVHLADAEDSALTVEAKRHRGLILGTRRSYGVSIIGCKIRGEARELLYICGHSHYSVKIKKQMLECVQKLQALQSAIEKEDKRGERARNLELQALGSAIAEEEGGGK